MKRFDAKTQRRKERQNETELTKCLIGGRMGLRTKQMGIPDRVPRVFRFLFRVSLRLRAFASKFFRFRDQYGESTYKLLNAGHGGFRTSVPRISID